MRSVLVAFLSCAAAECVDGEQGTCDSGAKGSVLLQSRKQTTRTALTATEEVPLSTRMNLLYQSKSQGKRRGLQASASTYAEFASILNKFRAKGTTPTDCSTCKGCLVDGECHMKAPGGADATASECAEYGLWCPTSTGPPNSCTSDAEFMADKVIGEECEFEGSEPGQADCEAKGCHFDEDDAHSHCHCEQAECAGAGGTWAQHTCSEVSYHMTSVVPLAIKAMKKGTCEGIKSHGVSLTFASRMAARMCCKNFPKSKCEPDAEFHSPCASEDDFNPAGVVNQHCKFHEEVAATDCESKGCEDMEGLCHCEAKDACEALGGEFHIQTCAETRQWWDDASEAFGLAKKLGSCDAVQDALKTKGHPGPPVALMGRHYAASCCASFPKWRCNPEGTIYTPCKNDADFTKDVVAFSGCDLGMKEGNMTQAACEQSGCDFYADELMCHCDSSEKCTKADGMWYSETCGEAIAPFNPLLRKARKQGGCDGVETPWGDDFDKSYLKLVAKGCCTTFPETVCGTIE